jgi:hypothetical protein
MPRFYFDLQAGNVFLKDNVGVELASDREAEKEAGITVTSLAHDELLCAGDSRDFVADVRRADGEKLLSIRLSLHIQYDGKQKRCSACH